MSSAPSSIPAPHPRPWEDKNPWISGILAYLIPGAGHFYQGRMVKGMIYCVSILGLFFWGLKMGEGTVVYGDITLFPPRVGPLSYVAQLGVGSLALPAALQSNRANHPSNQVVKRLTGPFTAQFEGTLHPSENPGHLVGTLRLDPVEGQFGPEVQGTFEGTLDGQAIKLPLGGRRFEIDRPIKAGFRRKLECTVLDEDMAAHPSPRWISGSIPRSIIDAYGVTPDANQLQDLDRLGKYYELALVFTWIAGLLNFLAIWDCVYGPAYGFGDEQPPGREAESRTAAEPASPATAGSAQPTPPQTSPPEEPPRVENRPAQKSPV
jgi:hypothetical protein